MLKNIKMNTITKICKWTSFAVLLFSSAWIAFSAYMVNGFSQLLPENLETLSKNTSLATVVTIDSWLYLLSLSLVYVASAIFIAKEVEASALFYVSIAVSSFMCAFIINILVVSTGFELTSL